jgi:hypothetical protein
VSFQQKCFDVFNRLRDEGKTILFVTHDMSAVRRFCHRAALIDRGRVVMIGDPGEVAASYVDVSFGATTDREPVQEGARGGDGTAEMLEAWWTDEQGERQTVLHQGRPCTFHARVRFNAPVEHPAIATVFENESHQPLMATSSEWADAETGFFDTGSEAEFAVQFDMAFAPGRVYASPWVAHQGTRVMDRRPRMSSVIVTGAHQSGGLVDLPHDVRLEAGDRVLTGQGGA